MTSVTVTCPAAMTGNGCRRSTSTSDTMVSIPSSWLRLPRCCPAVRLAEDHVRAGEEAQQHIRHDLHAQQIERELRHVGCDREVKQPR